MRRSGIVADGTVAQDGTQAGAIWALRESISEGLRHRGAREPAPAADTDLAMPQASHAVAGSGLAAKEMPRLAWDVVTPQHWY